MSFQYISCYCLSQNVKSKLKLILIFQYISCYCLSNKANILEGEQNNFNTSHVTVYRLQACTVHRYAYISIHLMLLFILSLLTKFTTVLSISIHLMLLFICISAGVTLVVCYFNTSHVTVYLTGSSTRESRTIYFNTSHVTVYHHWKNAKPRWMSISIHLMLLFIVLNSLSDNPVSLFQYISCYCLSLVNWLVKIFDFYFNTSHVTVYHR